MQTVCDHLSLSIATGGCPSERSFPAGAGGMKGLGFVVQGCVKSPPEEHGHVTCSGYHGVAFVIKTVC